MVEILRNLWKADICGTRNPIVILDEPTSALGENDVLILFNQMQFLKKQASIIFISHKLNEIVKMCDRTYVLKDGKNVGTLLKGESSEDILRKRMIGGVIEGEYYLVNEQRKPGEKVVLDIRKLSKKGIFNNISFKVHEGEIFSITGTVGSGKESICDALYGLCSYDEGEIFLESKKVKINSPVDANNLGIGISPDDRKGKGLILGMSVSDNITISIMKGIISIKNLAKKALQIIERLRILTPSEKTLIRNLSGGNQQKAIIGRLLLSDFKLVIMAFPTRGVDVGAKREIYSLIREMAKKNTAIILMGDSFEEDIGLANKIMALRDGICTGILDADFQKPKLNELANYIL
jgi:ribose transport system ATP-binding protein